MHILLTGATGTIGSHLAKELVRRGCKLTTLSRNPEKALLAQPFPAEIMLWKKDSPLVFHEPVDGVIHLAGENIAAKPWTEERREELRSSRVDTTHNLVRSFERSGFKPKFWINASAIGFYGDKAEAGTDERSPKGNDFLADLCDTWEKASAPVESWGTRRVLLRTAVVLEKRSGLFAELLPLFRASLGGSVGNGKQHVSWIHIDDHVRAVLKAVDDESIAGPMNAVAPQPISNRDFATTLAQVLEKPALLPVPKVAVALKLGQGRASLAFADQQITPKVLLERHFSWKFPSCKEALLDLVDYEKDFLSRELYTEQWLDHPQDRVFEFFSDEKNLERITPPWLNFRVVKKNTAELNTGTLIDYRLRIKGMPARWRTKIEQWNPPHEFSDIQLKGPYERWDHCHSFAALGRGTLMVDRVLYRLPLGVLGMPVLPLIKADVEAIFAYRRKAIMNVLGGRR